MMHPEDGKREEYGVMTTPDEISEDAIEDVLNQERGPTYDSLHGFCRLLIAALRAERANSTRLLIAIREIDTKVLHVIPPYPWEIDATKARETIAEIFKITLAVLRKTP